MSLAHLNLTGLVPVRNWTALSAAGPQLKASPNHYTLHTIPLPRRISPIPGTKLSLAADIQSLLMWPNTALDTDISLLGSTKPATARIPLSLDRTMIRESCKRRSSYLSFRLAISMCMHAGFFWSNRHFGRGRDSIIQIEANRSYLRRGKRPRMTSANNGRRGKFRPLCGNQLSR